MDLSELQISAWTSWESVKTANWGYAWLNESRHGPDVIGLARVLDALDSTVAKIGGGISVTPIGNGGVIIICHDGTLSATEVSGSCPPENGHMFILVQLSKR